MIWRGALFNFFSQDDFIFIEHFSQNNLASDIRNVFGPPTVTHWRPLHNLYFLIAGNIFAKNFIGYHLLTFAVVIITVFFVYKISQFLTKNNTAAVVSAIFYLASPSHFVSMFWISGAATLIGFLFLAVSFWSYLSNKKLQSFVFFILAILASEAMIVGIIVFSALIVVNNLGRDFKFLLTLILGSLPFALVKLIFTSRETFEVYKLEVSTRTVDAVIYYITRILGFSETSQDQLTSFGLLLLWSFIIVSSSKFLLKNYKRLILPSAAIFAGLFPFILIPSHLSAHYMNISIWGLSMILALVFARLRNVSILFIAAIFLAISLINIEKTKGNNWVVTRSNLAKEYIKKIENDNPPTGSTLVFKDSQLSTAQEAYIALGTGEAIKFWFADRNYTTCFSAFEDCLEK